MFNCKVKLFMFHLFLLLIIIATSEGRCLLNNNLCNRKARYFKSIKDKIPDSDLFTMKKPENTIHYQPIIITVSSKIESKKNPENTIVPVRQEDNMQFSRIRHPLSRKSLIQLNETSHNFKHKFRYRHPKQINRKKSAKRKKKYNFYGKSVRQRTIDEKQRTAGVNEQLRNSTINKLLENHFRKPSHKKVTKRPIVFKMKHHRKTVSEMKTNNQKLKKQFNFDSISKGFNVSRNENFIKSFALRNNTNQNLRNLNNKFQLINISKKLPKNVLHNISGVDILFGKIPASFYPIHKEQFDGVDVKDSNRVISFNPSNITNTKSDPFERNDKYVKRIDTVSFVTKAPVQSFLAPVSHSSAGIPPRIYRSDVKELNKNQENASVNIRYPYKRKIKQSRNYRDEFKQKISEKNPEKRDFYTAHAVIFTIPPARIWYEKDQQNYLQSKVKIHLPEMDSKENNTMAIDPFWKNLQKSEIVKSNHVHYKLYHPNLQTHPRFLNATAQHEIKKLLLLLKKMINNSKSETEVSRNTSSVETHAATYSSTVTAQNKGWLSIVTNPPNVNEKYKEWLSNVSHSPKVNAENKELLSTISYPPKMNGENKGRLGVIPEISEDRKDAANASYITIEYQRKAKIIVTPVNSDGTNYVRASLGFLGLLLIIIVGLSTIKLVLAAIERKKENKSSFSPITKIKTLLNSGREGEPIRYSSVPTEDNIHPDIYRHSVKDNRELNRIVNRVLGEMQFYSHSQLEELYHTKKHNKKLDNTMRGIIR